MSRSFAAVGDFPVTQFFAVLVGSTLVCLTTHAMAHLMSDGKVHKGRADNPEPLEQFLISVR